ncbi:MAG TPA: UDP-N-acetylmuramoyl-tripeptide--D-alanyl-D-alanine ligase [Chitinophagaceae bacterium]|nr:UDP-N-acetylmuramoyl-tripeptide--D-alanyl-D-alanine ligase [Chitinophagaceae bacterium]
MGVPELYQIYLQYPQVQTDTRQIRPGDLFFALRGDKFDGNAFVREALERGAAYGIIDNPAYEVPGRTILVEQVLTTLQELARHHRQQFSIPFLAITGSNGKTTTKELIHAVLSSRFRTYTTQGNLNNHIGIPLTLLRIRRDAEMAVIEMGANHQGEIAGYCTYTLPTYGLITNCGKAHLEGFGGVEGVRKGKGELYDYLRLHQGAVFIMWDYEYLRDMSRGISRVFTYGTRDADITGQAVQSEPFLEVAVQGGMAPTRIPTQLVGDYNTPNVLAAVAVGKYFGVDEDAIRRAIMDYQPSNSRSQLVERGSNRIILDAYNANPSSMRLAIENFARLHAPGKVLVLGAMAELGPDSLAEHRAIVALIGQYPWDRVLLVGGDFLRIDHPYLAFPDAAAAGAWLRDQHFENHYFLVKGSRSMQMEKVLDT